MIILLTYFVTNIITNWNKQVTIHYILMLFDIVAIMLRLARAFANYLHEYEYVKCN